MKAERTLVVEPGDNTDTCPLCGIHRQNAGFLKETCGDGYLKPGCFIAPAARAALDRHTQTQADNMADAATKNRVRGKVMRGEENPQAKLNERKVRAARLQYAMGEISLRRLAREYGVDRKTMTQAIRGERWSHV